MSVQHRQQRSVSYMCAREAIPGDGVGKVTVSMVCGPTLVSTV